MESSEQPQPYYPSYTSCERCQRRKIKCDKRQPCSKCYKANVECKRKGSGEKQRPATKAYVQALEAQVASLELFLQKLAVADDTQRGELLSEYHGNSEFIKESTVPKQNDSTLSNNGQLAFARTRAGHLRKLRAKNASQFYGGTSLFQIQESKESITTTGALNIVESTTTGFFSEPDVCAKESPENPRHLNFEYGPQHEIPRQLLTIFFKQQYPYNMCVYREYFLRDYDALKGPYYSEVLLYAICSMAALASENQELQSKSTLFSAHAQSLLYQSLDSPDLTVLQALLLLGQREIGQGNGSKGWLFCGMAFRLTHEMGLHLDPNNWDDSTQPSVDIEVLRRVYWAAFIVDKQLSLYFGRPPALYPHESDVRNTIRIPYPPEWQKLLDTYIAKGISADAFEDGIALVGSLTYQVELCKIFHNMISKLYQNRSATSDPTIMATKTQQVHVSLVGWLSSLPGKLHWNQWTVGQVPPYILHLHMLFHTAMIILHRPPRHYLEEPGIATSEDVEICYESLRALIRLMKTYSRYYHYRSLPFDFIHTLSTAAGVILMKRYLEKAPMDDTEISKSLHVVLEAMDGVMNTWPFVSKIKMCVMQAMESQTVSTPQTDPIFHLGLDLDLSTMPDPFLFLGDTGVGFGDTDLGFLVTDDALATTFTWDEMQPGFAGSSIQDLQERN
ncbi:hypothetical protein BU24DRAFT_427754 [Aaosphaeria arxii CBS 175.79]|uniref:Zn(2)-C6 fungal-type domain-containing protein n=1 Tax=Aaosphaeria arxii CBS 175.79 TaxID=1450172 RepID=A0A6A5XCJ7_9PLEO|nr:uncharacterized protein BU24DRAFT_427754 [Aaosphaeria arxii CBS 175.79]KAF2010639.1 hypothetical protein BU24DRAFT_427754 [Aaosphaeria arxii CBS 175.79]